MVRSLLTNGYATGTKGEKGTDGRNFGKTFRDMKGFIKHQILEESEVRQAKQRLLQGIKSEFPHCRYKKEIRRRMITCCLNCISRCTACHDTCEKYKAEKKDFEERKAFVHELNHSQSVYTAITRTSTGSVARNGFSEVNLEVNDGETDL